MEESTGTRSGGFLPVCSYSNRLRSRIGAAEALESLAGSFSPAAIVIADELQRINLQLRGASSEEARRSSSIAGSNSLRMYESLAYSKHFSAVSVVSLAKLRVSPEFMIAEQKSLPALYSVDRFRKETSKFISLVSRRFGWHNDSTAQALEIEYLNLEIVTSIFMAELAGYPFEVWEDLPRPLTPDPLTVAYSSAADELRSALGKSTLDRRLVSLKSLVRVAVG